ncbi:MAG TPA: hypothetical protein VFR79_00280, partial [Nitrospira sp.]|nr:hypothetical protein [Nitrospira sp.]
CSTSSADSASAAEKDSQRMHDTAQTTPRRLRSHDSHGQFSTRFLLAVDHPRRCFSIVLRRLDLNQLRRSFS